MTNIFPAGRMATLVHFYGVIVTRNDHFVTRVISSPQVCTIGNFHPVSANYGLKRLMWHEFGLGGSFDTLLPQVLTATSQNPYIDRIYVYFDPEKINSMTRVTLSLILTVFSLKN